MCCVWSLHFASDADLSDTDRTRAPSPHCAVHLTQIQLTQIHQVLKWPLKQMKSEVMEVVPGVMHYGERLLRYKEGTACQSPDIAVGEASFQQRYVLVE